MTYIHRRNFFRTALAGGAALASRLGYAQPAEQQQSNITQAFELKLLTHQPDLFYDKSAERIGVNARDGNFVYSVSMEAEMKGGAYRLKDQKAPLILTISDGVYKPIQREYRNPKYIADTDRDGEPDIVANDLEGITKLSEPRKRVFVGKLPEAERKKVVEMYDNGISALDAEIDRRIAAFVTLNGR